MQTSPVTLAQGPTEQIRALFLDIDGTLVGGSGQISGRVIEAVRMAYDRGCEVVLCTGRTRFRTIPVAKQLGLPLGYAITSNGGVLTHLGGGTLIYRHLLPVAAALDVIQTIREAGAEPFVYEDSDRPGIEGARVLYHPEADTKSWTFLDTRYRPHTSIMSEIPFEPVSISAYGAPGVMRPLAAHLREILAETVSIIESGTESNWGVEVYVRGISKRYGLEILAKRLDVNRNEVMAIGDHMNDIDMLEWAAWGVAMGNAQPEVKAAADTITTDVDGDGVAVAIERYVLGNRY